MCTNEVPDWDTGLVNLRDRLPLSHAHFTGAVAFQKGRRLEEGGAIVEAHLDTGGARTMTDEMAARLAKLPAHHSTKD